MTDTQTVIEKLAAMEVVCPDRQVTWHKVCDKCKGTSIVPRFPLARVECLACARIPDGKRHVIVLPHQITGADCPGWRVATLDEIRLEDVLKEIFPGSEGILFESDRCESVTILYTTQPKPNIVGSGFGWVEAASDALLQAVES